MHHPDSATALLRSVRASFSPAAGFAMEELTSRKWASVTFRGQRHGLTFYLEGEGAENEAERFVSGLAASQFDLPGHLLADVSVLSQERRPGRTKIQIEALTVEVE